jgi:hypothetical protein
MGMTLYWISIGVMAVALVAILGVNMLYRRRDRDQGR